MTYNVFIVYNTKYVTEQNNERINRTAEITRFSISFDFLAINPMNTSVLDPSINH